MLVDIVSQFFVLLYVYVDAAKDICTYLTYLVYLSHICGVDVGVLISHIRRQKVSEQGAAVLMRDLEEYQNMVAVLGSPETLDMIICLKEIAVIYRTAPEQVAKVIMEDLRHLDMDIVLSLTRSRDDITAFADNPWVRKLGEAVGGLNWDAPLSWEAKQNNTMASFTDYALSQVGMGSDTTKVDLSSQQVMGPTSLRNSSTPMAAVFLAQHLSSNNTRMHSNLLSEGISPLASSSGDRRSGEGRTRGDGVESRESMLANRARTRSRGNTLVAPKTPFEKKRTKSQAVNFTPVRPDLIKSEANTHLHATSKDSDGNGSGGLAGGSGWMDRQKPKEYLPKNIQASADEASIGSTGGGSRSSMLGGWGRGGGRGDRKSQGTGPSFYGQNAMSERAKALVVSNQKSDPDQGDEDASAKAPAAGKSFFSKLFGT